MIVVDSSVALKWIKLDEAEREKALLLYRSHIAGKEKITVPRLLFIEAANALATKSHTTQGDIKEGLKFLFNVNLDITKEDDKTLLQAARLAKKYNTSVYDMLYAVVAKKHKTHLITADDNFARKTGFKFVKLLKDIEIDSNGKQNIN